MSQQNIQNRKSADVVAQDVVQVGLISLTHAFWKTYVWDNCDISRIQKIGWYWLPAILLAAAIGILCQIAWLVLVRVFFAVVAFCAMMIGGRAAGANFIVTKLA